MSYATERSAIEAAWQAGWITAPNVERTPTSYEGVPFDMPTTAWVRLTIRNGQAAQLTIGAPGSNTHRHPGVIMVDVFVPSGDGTAPLRALLDAASAVYRNQTFGNVRCREAWVEMLGVEGPWVRGMMRCNFYRDEFL